jgi:hypothetical protein
LAIRKSADLLTNSAYALRPANDRDGENWNSGMLLTNSPLNQKRPGTPILANLP